MQDEAVSRAAKEAPNDAKEYGIGLCLSGGGYRAKLFHAGALARLNDAGLLSKVEVVGSVSGGSIAAGILAKAWRDLTISDGVAVNFNAKVLEPILGFSQVFVDGPSLLKGILYPWSTAARQLSLAYRRHLFGETMLSDLGASPWFIFCASNLNTGSLFRMSNRYLADYRIGVAWGETPGGDVGADLPLADAVACSSAFPPFFSPFRLDLSKFEWCDEKLDGGVGSRVSPGRAALTDGGVYDNHGIEPVMKRSRTLFVSDGGAPWRQSGSGFRNWFGQLKRVVDTTDNQVRSLRRRALIQSFDAARKAACAGVDIEADADFTRGCYWSIAPSEKILAQAPALRDFLASQSGQPMDLPTVLHFLGETETEAAVNWGYLVADHALRAHYDADLPRVEALPVVRGSVKPTPAARRSRAFMRLFGL